MNVVVNSIEETQHLAERFSKKLKPGQIIRLEGDLGAGKTTFVRFVLKSLGVKGEITSPTFSILKSYKGKFLFHHFDMYRINEEEAIELGFDEILSGKNSVIFIEWSENIESLLPPSCALIKIQYIDENKREFSFENIEF